MLTKWCWVVSFFSSLADPLPVGCWSTKWKLGHLTCCCEGFFVGLEGLEGFGGLVGLFTKATFSWKSPIHLWQLLGAEFVVYFSSGSRSLALKSSSKSHEITTFFVPNDKGLAKTTSFCPQSSFWMKKGVIWWLFDDDLRAREREPEKKVTKNSAPKLIKAELADFWYQK